MQLKYSALAMHAKCVNIQLEAVIPLFHLH